MQGEADDRRPDQTPLQESFDLERFVSAQSPVMAEVIRELTAGRKETHWMWFVFPQLRGLGSSSMAHRYGIGSRDEAVAYLGHPLLGPRLVYTTDLVLTHLGRSAHAIFGSPDDMKFHSCMTLFHHAADGKERAFERALHTFFEGQQDARTLALLQRS